MAEPTTKLVDGERVELTDQEQEEIQARWDANTPSLSEAKSQRIKEIKDKANNVLSKTDWYITREQETGESIPQDVLDHRSQVRSDSDTFEREVNNFTTVEEVVNYEYSFPGPPEP